MAIDAQIRALATGQNLDHRLKTQALSIDEQDIRFISACKPLENVTAGLKTKYVILKPFCGSTSPVSSPSPSPARPSKLVNSSNNNSTLATKCQQQYGTSTSSGRMNDGVPEPSVDLWDKVIQMEWPRDSSVLHSPLGMGLHNMGNTCFLNSVLQIMTHTPPLVSLLIQHHNPQTCEARRIQHVCAMCLMRSHIVRALGHHTNSGSFTPNNILDKMRVIMKSYIRGRQEDAHEFLRFLVDAMCNSAIAGHRKLDMFTKQTSAINKIFGGYYRNEITCLCCQERSTTYDPLLDLSLEVKPCGGKLEDALNQFTKVEILKSDNAYKCQRCKKTVSAKKMYTIHRAPNVLTIQLKRFNHSLGKINASVKFPDRLNLRNYMSDKHGPNVMYSLYGVVVHHGGSTNSGHYFAFTKNTQGNWHMMDDNRVCTAAARTVLNQHAYLLFYMRVDTQIAAVRPQTRPTPSPANIPSPAAFLALPKPNVHKVEPIVQSKLILPERSTPAKTPVASSNPNPVSFSFPKKHKLLSNSLVKPKIPKLETKIGASAETSNRPLVPYDDDDSPSNSDPSSPNVNAKSLKVDDSTFSYNVFEQYKVKSPKKDKSPVAEKAQKSNVVIEPTTPKEGVDKTEPVPGTPIRLKVDLKTMKVIDPEDSQGKKEGIVGEEEGNEERKRDKKRKKKKKKHRKEREEEGIERKHKKKEKRKGKEKEGGSLEGEKRDRHSSEKERHSLESVRHGSDEDRRKKRHREKHSHSSGGSDRISSDKESRTSDKDRHSLEKRERESSDSDRQSRDASPPNKKFKVDSVDIVRQLKQGHGYGSLVKSWNGGSNVLVNLNAAEEEKKAEERKRQLEHNEFDAPLLKQHKNKHQQYRNPNTNYNRFQHKYNNNQRWNHRR